MSGASGREDADGCGLVACDDATTGLKERQCVEESFRALTRSVSLERSDLAHAQALAKVGSWRSDLDGTNVIWSDEAYRIFGMVPDEGGGGQTAFARCVHPDDARAVWDTFKRALARQEHWMFEHRVLLGDGTVKWVQQRCEFPRDEFGVQYVAGTIQDITERKAFDAAVRQNEQLLRIAGRVGRIGGWQVDLSQGSVLWSDEVCGIHGVPPGFVPTLDEAFAFYAPEYRAEITRLVQACIGEGTPFDTSLEIITRDGERVWVRAIGEAHRDSSGEVVTRISGAFQDISERMQAVRALRESDQRFRLVAQATSDAVWDWNLLEGTCWWGEGSHTKFGYADNARASRTFWEDNIHPDDRIRVLESLVMAVASAKLWLEEYRFRRADGTYALVADRALPMRDDLGRPCRMLGAMVDITHQRSLEVRLDEAERLSSVGQLATNMAHEFNNVLMSIQPFVEVLRHFTAGIGKAQDAVGHILQSVRRGKEITDGILELTRHVQPVTQPADVRDWLLDLVGAADGDAQATRGVMVEDDLREAPPMRASAGKRTLPGMVLIVDDEPSIAEGISMLLQCEGVESRSIFEGASAIEAIASHAPDLVLLDIGLPDISGVEVFKLIQDRWPELPVVLMTGHYSAADLGPILALPHAGFLQKPFGADELLAMIVPR